VRSLCPRCRERYEPNDAELDEIGLLRVELPDGQLYRAAGCTHCNNTGYHGRTAIYEILVVDDAIRKLVSRGIDSKTIEDEAIRSGMMTMRMHGAQKVLAGVTSVAEVLRQTEEEASRALDAVQS
jgi:type II secretory ATPase GspE/PulE/Tfp pilus assembly ATPase PilB-like protein